MDFATDSPPSLHLVPLVLHVLLLVHWVLCLGLLPAPHQQPLEAVVEGLPQGQQAVGRGRRRGGQLPGIRFSEGLARGGVRPLVDGVAQLGDGVVGLSGEHGGLVGVKWPALELELEWRAESSGVWINVLRFF